VIRVELLTDRPERRFTPGARLHPEGSDEVLTIAAASPVADGPGWWLTFREVGDRTAAERLRNLYLETDVDVDAEREPGRWLWHELVGLAARSGDGRDLGRIHDIYRAGETEVFVLRGPAGELDVPGVRGIVLELAPERGEIVVNLDALDLDARPVDDKPVRPRDRRRQGAKRAEPEVVSAAPPAPDPGPDDGPEPPPESSS
jgi:16S rRNA processing protein RimM